MPTPLVSIIIPCYNAEKYVAEAIQSALDQTYPNCEVIVIDDGSTDGSLEVIQSFGDKIRCEIGPNRGGCAARNRGIELSKGEFIKFLDSDDMLTPECIKNEVSCEPRDHVIVCSSPGVVDGSGLSELSSKWLHKSYDLKTLIFDGTPQTSAPLHRKSDLLKIGGFTDGLPCSQEYDLHLRLAIFLGMTYRILPEIGFLIRPRMDSLSRRSEAPIASTRMRILLAISNSLRDRRQETGDRYLCASSKKQTLDLLSQALVSLARSLWRNGDHDAAADMAKKARKISNQWHQGIYRNRVISMISRVFGFSFYENLHAFISKIASSRHK